ncbi:pyridoxamine 5'-phosphate oxidase family protein [Candidatus Saccharibacteria bacterium]|nr:pyridoxamine 5'-phosphate oxidase family protein [Candidatus Saccharibacteria bacterium]
MDIKSQAISKEAVRHFLESNFIAELATASNNKPTCSTVIYVVDKDLNLYFVTNRDSHKAENILKNQNVSMTIWEFSKMSIQLDGLAKEVNDDSIKEWVINSFGDAATNDPDFWAPIFRINRGDYVIFKVTPTWLRALDLAHDTVRSKLSPYTEISLHED